MGYETDLKLFIDGVWKSADAGHTVLNPADASPIAEVPYATAADLDANLAFLPGEVRMRSRLVESVAGTMKANQLIANIDIDPRRIYRNAGISHCGQNPSPIRIGARPGGLHEW